jgi:hypothetical protein
LIFRAAAEAIKKIEVDIKKDFLTTVKNRSYVCVALVYTF